MYGRALGVFLTFGALTLAACVSDNPGSGGPSCDDYCTTITKQCDGAKAQYQSASECLKACALLPLGTTGDGDINTIGCRLRKAQAATTAEECVAAGPFGGGVCGTRCASFCAILSKNCSGQPDPVFNSEATCNEECSQKFTTVVVEGEVEAREPISSKNTLNCRMQHTILSLGDPVTHCRHPGVQSPVCNQ